MSCFVGKSNDLINHRSEKKILCNVTAIEHTLCCQHNKCSGEIKHEINDTVL